MILIVYTKSIYLMLIIISSIIIHNLNYEIHYNYENAILSLYLKIMDTSKIDIGTESTQIRIGLYFHALDWCTGIDQYES